MIYTVCASWLCGADLLSLKEMRVSVKKVYFPFIVLAVALQSTCGRIGYESVEIKFDSDTGTGGDTDTDSDTDTDTDTDSDTDIDTSTDTEIDTGLEIHDPLGDASSFSFVFPYRGRIWMGPRRDGTGAVTLQPGATAVSSVSFSFVRDVAGDNRHRNVATAPYPGIGATGCQVGTHSCGPDDENGRGLFFSGTVRGEEWLVVAGGRSDGDLDYVYMTKDNDDVLNFQYVDMSDSMGPQTKGFSALHIFDNRVYFGAPDTGGRRPYLMMIVNLPEGSGMDASGNIADRFNDQPCDPKKHDVCTLRTDMLPGIGLSAEAAMIDSITDFTGRLYVANNGGVARSRVAQPLDAFNYPEHWALITPSNSDYTGLTSIATTKTANIEPADKAVPAMVVFRDRLFLARNTTLGPQLWVCDPATVSGPAPATSTDCDSGDWKLVAPNRSLNRRLTQFDNGSNSVISFLQASADYLYIGFDNRRDGVALFRTASANPAMADFEGDGGCPALDHPTTCEGIGGDGFGSSGNSRILSATIVSTEKNEYLYAIVGNGTGPVRLVAQIQ